MAYVAADYVIIPTECDDGSLDGIMAIAEDIRKLRDGRTQSSHAEILGIVLTKKENTIMHADALDSISAISDTISENPFIMSVRKSIIVSECKKLKMPINEYEAKSNPAEDYRAIAKEIISRIGE